MKKLIFVIAISLVYCYMFPMMVNCEEDLSNLVEVKKIDMDFAGKDKNEIAMMLMDNFMNKPHEMQFNKVTTDDWVAKYEHYKEVLLNKAAQQGLDVEGLKKALTLKGKEVANLPVEAYLAKLGQDDVWVIVSKWEFISKDRVMSFGHVSITAYKVSDNSVIGFASCR